MTNEARARRQNHIHHHHHCGIKNSKRIEDNDRRDYNRVYLVEKRSGKINVFAVYTGQIGE